MSNHIAFGDSYILGYPDPHKKMYMVEKPENILAKHPKKEDTVKLNRAERRKRR